MEMVRTIKNRMRMGGIVKEKFASRAMGEMNIRDSMFSASSEYGKPATKGDINMLAYEIIKLANMIGGRV